MRKSSRLALLGISVLTTTALVSGTAGAQGAGAAADQFGATANAESLVISIAGQQLTGSKVTATLDDAVNADPTSAATASLLLTPAFSADDIKASATTAAPSDVKQPESCTGNELEAIPGVARLDITCPEVAAQIVGGLPSARALGAQLVVEPSVSGVLDTLGLQEPVVDGANQVFEQVLNPLVEALTGNPIGDLASDTVQTVQDVINDTLTLNSTARIVVAPALAEVTSSADRVVSTAHAQGIRIELLPVNELGATNGLLPDDLVPGEPLVTITVGNAKAIASYDRLTGAKLPPVAEAAAVTIEFGSTALTDALGLSAEPIVVGQNTEQCVLQGTPLETCVTVASAGVDADGNPYATSTGISLFRGINGGINLATGGVTSGAAGALIPAVAAPAADLPRTGANAVIPALGGGLLALAVLTRRFFIGRA